MGCGLRMMPPPVMKVKQNASERSGERLMSCFISAFVTTFIFRVRNVPAALYKALGGFATNGVNMTKLESYMVGGEFTATQFLAEVDADEEEVAPIVGVLCEF
mgnify:CR=1 FL=1